MPSTLPRMNWVDILMIAAGLSADAFAVALGAGASGRAPGERAAIRLSFHFGLFQFLMPVIGSVVAFSAGTFLSRIDHWVAFGLLSLVGGKMLYAGFAGLPPAVHGDPSRGMSLVSLSMATSIDALAIGFTLAMVGVRIWWPSIIIGLMTGGLSLVGVALGTSLGMRLGQRMEIAGGVILTATGIRMLVTHLSGG